MQARKNSASVLQQLIKADTSVDGNRGRAGTRKDWLANPVASWMISGASRPRSTRTTQACLTSATNAIRFIYSGDINEEQLMW
jgi:hypothetical protein